MKHKINKHIIIITTIALACLLAIFSCDTFSSDNRFATKTGELKIFSLNFRPLHNAHSLEIGKKYILPKNRISSIVLPNVNDTEFSKWNTKISEKNDINQAEVDFWNNSEHRFVRWELNSASNHGKLKIETDYENADIEKDETGYFGKHTKKDGTQEKTFLGADIKSAISKLLEKYSDVYFTAIWQMPYRVIYKQEQASDYDMYFSWYDEQLLTYSTLYGEQGQTLTFPASDASNTELTAFGLREAPTGFIFKGIFTDESFTTSASATLNYNSPTNIQTFYAKYDRKQVTLTFNAGDGEFLGDNSTQKVVTAKYGVEMNTYCPTPKTTITVGAETKTFSHWQPTLPETVPLTDTTYTAIYTGTGGGTGGGSSGGTGEPEPEPDPEPVDTTPPGQVTNVVASAKYRQIDLSWNNPTDSDFASIRIEYSKKNDASNKNTINLTSSENSYSFTDLEPNETVYSFVISTFDTSGNSANYTTEFSTITDFVRIPENTITNAMYPDSEVFIAGRTVKLNEFYISTHEVTQEEYYAVMNTAPSTFNNSPAENEIQGYRPVETVDWYDAVLYCNTRSTNEGLTPYYQITNSAGEKSTWQITCVTTANGYRLPTEAEWEYVALNFQQSSPTTYAGGNTIDNVAWVDSNSSEKTHAVTQKQPTSAGIFDMSGNVWEWCFDYYKSDLETSTPATGPTTGSYNYKVKRGGSYYDEAAESGVFYRSYSTATNSDDNIGFRVVKNVPHEPEPEPEPEPETFTVRFESSENALQTKTENYQTGNSLVFTSCPESWIPSNHNFSYWQESSEGTKYNIGDSFIVSESGLVFQAFFEEIPAQPESLVLVPSFGDIKSFYISDHEVTQQEFQTIMGYNPSEFQNSPATGETQELRPVENVSWYEAIAYCNKLSLEEDLTPFYSLNGETNPNVWGSIPTSQNNDWDSITCDFTANGYRLPTLIEWGHAAAGALQSTDPRYTTYSGSNDIDIVAWHSGNSIPDGRYTPITHQVKTKQANILGLYDMNGNVHEWCWDEFGGNLNNRTIAGGSCEETGGYCDILASDKQRTHIRYQTTGFRVVKNVPHEPEPEPVDPTPTALGDIAYTDRTTSPSAEGVVSGKTPIGLVIEVTDGKATKIMSLTEENKAWNSDYNNFAFIPPVSNDDGSLIKDYYFEQGYNSTGARATEGNNLAALRYTEELSTATGIDWYIPSYEEGYNIFITNFTLYDSILATISGAVQIQQEDYWTSTYEDDWLDEFHEIVNEPGISYEYTTSSSLEYAFAIRCVAKFTEN